MVEEGTHDVLMAARGHYAALLSRQQLEEAIEAADTPADSDTGDLVRTG